VKQTPDLSQRRVVPGSADMDRLTDEELLALTPEGPEAFASFYRRHERLLLSYFMRRTGDPELAADLAAETFAAALVGVRRFDAARGPALAWTFGIAHNTLQRCWERGRVEDRARRRLGMPPLAYEDEALERIERLGADDRAVALLEQLPPDQATALRARVIDEQPYPAIAARVRCSESVVRQRVSRGLAALRSIAKESS
jgi:RNA polymerase sigma factor (sigma-70 family)